MSRQPYLIQRGRTAAHLGPSGGGQLQEEHEANVSSLAETRRQTVQRSVSKLQVLLVLNVNFLLYGGLVWKTCQGPNVSV